VSSTHNSIPQNNEAPPQVGFQTEGEEKARIRCFGESRELVPCVILERAPFWLTVRCPKNLLAGSIVQLLTDQLIVMAEVKACESHQSEFVMRLAIDNTVEIPKSTLRSLRLGKG